MSTGAGQARGASVRAQLPKAWWSLALYPVTFVLAFIVGEGIPAWLGYGDPPTGMSWWAVALTMTAAVVVLALPLPVTAHFSRRAAAQGENGARVPLSLSLVGVACFVIVNLAGVAIMLVE